MKVIHLGNTANNAFHNAMILDEVAGIGSELPIRMFGLAHAISAPAWDVVEFDVPGTAWVPNPDWSGIPEAAKVMAKYTDLPQSGARGAHAKRRSSMAAVRQFVERTAVVPLARTGWARPVFDLRQRQVLARRPRIAEPDGSITLIYGADSLARLELDRNPARTACLEHGTVRWIADGSRDTAVFREAYREQVRRAQHLWVTNLDPRTLEIAEDVAPGRWSAFPHPFLPDPRVPFAESPDRRSALLARTHSSALILLPSSQNWSPHHDKGSIKALDAFIELRRRGVNVGLVAVEWGLQLAESKALLSSAGLAEHVAWVPPMARFGLQRMMADVDVVWDQFGLDAFGALVLRGLEQGTPLVSRGLLPESERLIGGPVPWLHAATVDDIVRQSEAVLDEFARRGRETVIADYRARYRKWLLERHSIQITAQLQQHVYERILVGAHGPGDAPPDQWARLLDADGEKENRDGD